MTAPNKRDKLRAEVEEAKREASTLATSIWRKEYQKESPQWGLCDSVAGIISQIDNMYAGVREQRDQARFDNTRLTAELEELKNKLDDIGCALLGAEMPRVDQPGLLKLAQSVTSERTRLTTELDAVRMASNPQPESPIPSGVGHRPTVVCLCGSSKYPDEHMRVMMEETLAGRIVIPMGLYGHADFPPGAKAATNDGDESTEVKQMLDKLHHRKIDLADEILVVNVGGYIGSSTKREIAYAESNGKIVRFLTSSAVNPSRPEPVKAGEWMPIESAPRCVNPGPRDNGRRPVLVTRYPANGVPPVAVARLTQEGWMSGKRYNRLWFQPTHWQPLPAPPIAPEGKETEGEV